MFADSKPVLYENDKRFAGQRRTDRFAWRQSLAWACLTAALAISGVLTLTQVSEFLYFQF